MEKVSLSKVEKQVLRILNAGENCPENLQPKDFITSCESLEQIGFALCDRNIKGEVVRAEITEQGETYILHNPTLNQMDWKWISINIILLGLAVLFGVTIIVSVIVNLYMYSLN